MNFQELYRMMRWSRAFCLRLVFVFTAVLFAVADLPNISPIRIDCGNTGTQLAAGWQKDDFFSGGVAMKNNDSYTLALSSDASTLRAFPGTVSGCYNVPVPSGRYFIRVGFVYKNYDGLKIGPHFWLSVENVQVMFVDTTVPLYREFLTPVSDGFATVCLLPSDGIPIINSLEIFPQDSNSYSPQLVDSSSYILSLFQRINAGGPQIPASQDKRNRTWSRDQGSEYNQLSAASSIAHADGPPDYLPSSMFQTAREAKSNSTSFNFWLSPLSPNNTCFLRLYFAELDPLVKKGDRKLAIGINVNGKSFSIGNSTCMDVLASYPKLTALQLSLVLNYSKYGVKVLEGSNSLNSFSITITQCGGSKKPPIVNGLEIFEMIPISGNQNIGVKASSSSPSSSSLSTGAIVGIAVTVAIIIGTLALLIIGFLFYSRKKRGYASTAKSSDRQAFMQGISRSAKLHAEETGVAGVGTPYTKFTTGLEDGEFKDVELSEGTR